MKHSTKGHAFTEIVIESFRLSGLLATEGDRIAAPLGLSSARWKILGALARSEHPLTVSQIARNMGQSRQAVQSLVNIMCETGLVEFQDNPNHKRAKLAVLTALGKSVYEKMEAIQIPWANECAGNMPIEDLKTTLATLKKIAKLFSA
ncbi:MAG: MarR family transcriptional regulator [Gammaproteobacteria bacterium]|nr:MarR family transcriptional regulator [Gammaproteobacteria bacterium]